MKLKADFANLPLLYKTILCCDKWIPKKADVQIAFMPGKVKIFSSSQDGLYACAELNAEHILENYIIQSKNNDIIWMELQLQPFLACLKTLSSCSNIQIQLIKKDRTPYLQFQSKKRINFGASNTANNAGAGRVMGLAESPSSRLMQSETQVDLVHDVACKLLSKAESDYLVLPELPEFKIPIMLPSVSTLKTIIDRMKKLSDTIDLSVNYRGQLNISISNIHFNVSTYFRNLIHPRVVGSNRNNDQRTRPDEFVTTRVQSFALQQFLQCDILQPPQVVCCSYGEKGVLMNVYLSSLEDQNKVGVLTFLIPGMLID